MLLKENKFQRVRPSLPFLEDRMPLIFLGAIAGAGLTLLVTQPRVLSIGSSAEAALSDTYQQLNLFGEVFERVRAAYVEKPS